MGLEGLDCFLGHVATVIVGWYELVRHIVVANCLLKIGRALVVDYVALGVDAGAF